MSQSPRKKKIFFLITKSNWGGAQRYVYDLATNLDKTRYEAVVAMGGTGLLKEFLEHAGIRTITITSLERDVNFRKEWEFGTELWRLLGNERPDVLHINSSKAGAVGTLLGRLRGVPFVVFTAHGWAFNEDRPYWQRVIIKAIHYGTVLLSHRTIAVSRAIIREMNWPGARRRLKLIHPGRTIGPMYEKAEAREKLLSFYPSLTPYRSDYWIGCVAELHPIKQHAILLAALREIRDIHPTVRLVCVGDGQLRDQLAAETRRLQLEEQVFFVGNVPEAARFMKAFDLLTLVSRSESYGYVLHEAGIAGVPIVASARGGILDIIDHEKTGLLVHEVSSKNIAAALHRLISAPQLGTDLANALSLKLESRTVRRMVAETSALYELG